MTRSPLQPGPATDHYHTALGVDGGASGLHLLGPFTVPYNDPQIASNFGIVALAELSPDSVVLKVWAVLTEEWDVSPATLTISITDTPDYQHGYDLSKLDLAGGDVPPDAFGWREIATDAWSAFSNVMSFVGGVGEDGGWLTATPTATNPGAGSVDVYALILMP